jgi:hypothetical protein
VELLGQDRIHRRAIRSSGGSVWPPTLRVQGRSVPSGCDSSVPNGVAARPSPWSGPRARSSVAADSVRRRSPACARHIRHREAPPKEQPPARGWMEKFAPCPGQLCSGSHDREGSTRAAQACSGETAAVRRPATAKPLSLRDVTRAAAGTEQANAPSGTIQRMHRRSGARRRCRALSITRRVSWRGQRRFRRSPRRYRPSRRHARRSRALRRVAGSGPSWPGIRPSVYGPFPRCRRAGA